MEWWQVQELMITSAVIVGVLVPVFAVTFRLIGRIPRSKELPTPKDVSATIPDRRLDHMERQLEELDGLVRRLVDAAEFDRQLRSGSSSETDR